MFSSNTDKEKNESRNNKEVIQRMTNEEHSRDVALGEKLIVVESRRESCKTWEWNDVSGGPSRGRASHDATQKPHRTVRTAYRPEDP